MKELSGHTRKKLTYGFILILGSVILSFVMVEAALRTLAHDRYHGARTLTSVPDNTKIWAPPENTVSYFRHPDTGERIELQRNNMGLRMKYDVSASSLEATRNIAFFGASFTENVRLPVQHTFPELFKFLVNIGDDKFEVLNFGVGAYGVDQSYLRYKELGTDIRKELDFVVVVVSAGDLWNPAKNKIAALDESGKLILTPRGPRVPTFLKVIKELYITYFLIDVYDFLVSSPENNAKLERKQIKDINNRKAKVLPEKSGATKLFNAIMLKWKSDVEAFGGKFKIVVVPLDDYWSVSETLDPHLPAIQLQELFAQLVPNDELSKLNFQNDPHWNESGNLLVAIALLMALRPELELRQLEDSMLVAELRNYYRHYTNGWQPGRVGKFRIGTLTDK